MNKQELLFRVVNEIYENNQHKSLSLSTRIDELDFDSMETLEFLMAIEKTFLVELKIEEMKICETLADILNLIDKNG
jgi:acyl carrier protein